MPRHLPLFAAFAVGLGVLGGSGPSFAEESAGMVVEGGYLYKEARVDRARLHTPATEPSILGPLYLDGSGTLVGGSFGVVGYVEGVRFGFSESFYGASGLHLVKDDPTPAGYKVSAAKAWGILLDMNVGKQMEIAGVRPYLDARIGVAMLNATIDVESDRLGNVGSTNYTAYRLSVGPRAGVMIPIVKHFFLDAACTYGILGHEGAGLTMNLGWDIFAGGKAF